MTHLSRAGFFRVARILKEPLCSCRIGILDANIEHGQPDFAATFAEASEPTKATSGKMTVASISNVTS